MLRENAYIYIIAILMNLNFQNGNDLHTCMHNLQLSYICNNCMDGAMVPCTNLL